MILRFLAFSLVTTSPLVAFAQAPAVPGNVRGRITDARSGAPIAGAKIAAFQSQRWGRVRSDSAGYYLLDRMPPGTWPVEFHCPSRTALGRRLGTRTITVPPAGDVILDVAVPPGMCDEPAYSVRRGIFRGHYSYGFEESRFLPCPDSAMGIGPTLMPGRADAAAWVRFSEDARQRTQWPTSSADTGRYPRRFMVVRGSLEGPSQYGHLGVSEYRLLVDSVLAVREPTPDDCSVSPQPPQN